MKLIATIVLYISHVVLFNYVFYDFFCLQVNSRLIEKVMAHYSGIYSPSILYVLYNYFLCASCGSICGKGVWIKRNCVCWKVRWPFHFQVLYSVSAVSNPKMINLRSWRLNLKSFWVFFSSFLRSWPVPPLAGRYGASLWNVSLNVLSIK